MAVEQKRLCGWRRIDGLYLCGDYTFHDTCDRMPFPLTTCPVCGQGIKVSRGFTQINPFRLFGNHDAELQSGHGIRCIDCSYGYAYSPDVGATDFVCQHPDNKDNSGCPLAKCQDVFRPCHLCDPQDQPAYIMMVGAGSYPTPQDFVREAIAQGISKRIPFIPKGLELGKTVVYLAHPKACEVRESVLQEAMAIVVEGGPTTPPRLLEAEKVSKAVGIFCAFIPKKVEKLVWESELTDERRGELEKRNITPIPVPDGDPDHK